MATNPTELEHSRTLKWMIEELVEGSKDWNSGYLKQLASDYDKTLDAEEHLCHVEGCYDLRANQMRLEQEYGGRMGTGFDGIPVEELLANGGRRGGDLD